MYACLLSQIQGIGEDLSTLANSGAFEILVGKISTLCPRGMVGHTTDRCISLMGPCTFPPPIIQ